MRIRVQKVRSAFREIEDCVRCEMLRQLEDNRQLIVSPSSGHGVDYPVHTLTAIVGFSGACGKNPILQKERLVPGEALFKKVSLPGLILSTGTILREDGVEFFLSLGSNVIIQILISICNVLSQVHFAGVNDSSEHTIPVVGDNISVILRFHQGKEEHILDIGGRHDMPALAGWSRWPDPDLVASFRADDGLRGVLPLWSIGVRGVGAEPVPEKLLHQGDLTVVPLGDVPHVVLTFSVTLARFPGTRKGPLGVAVHDLVIFNEHPPGLQVNAIVMGDHVVQGVVFLILDPFPLTGGFVGLISGQTGLGVGSAMDKAGNGSGLIQGHRVAEVPTMHRGGVGRRLITAGAEPGQTLFEGNPLRDREGPVDGV